MKNLWVATIVTTCLACAAAAAQQPRGKLKVFILAGQSNMQGKAAAYTLDAVIGDPKTRGEFGHLKKDGEWVVREDVWVTFLGNGNRAGFPLHGPLTVGYGSPKTVRDANNKKIPVPGVGPELGIGYVLGDHFDEQVLLIKAAWGGRAVRYGFRPPSAMPSDDEIEAEVAAIAEKRAAAKRRARAAKAAGRRVKAVPPERPFAAHKAGYGTDYRNVLAETKQVLENLRTYFPGYDPAQGYEIAGFIWFQGWNDAIGAGNPAYVEQMAHFIRDMRRDLGAPDMPFVIGELGTDGPDAGGWIATFRAQQAAIAALPEFRGNVALARTAHCWPTGLPDLQDEWKAFKAAARRNEAKPEDDPTRVDPGMFFNRNWLRKYERQLAYTSDKRYHYLGSGACYYRMGASMGEAMVALIEGRKK